MIFNLNTKVPYIMVDIIGPPSGLFIFMSSVNTLSGWSAELNPKTISIWNPEKVIPEYIKIGRECFTYYTYDLFVTFTTSFRENFKYLNEIHLNYNEEEWLNRSLYETYHSNTNKYRDTNEYMESFDTDFFTPPVNPMDKGG